MPKRYVEIEWDKPEYEGWLADDNIAYALHQACPNTVFKVKGIQESFQDAVRNDPDMNEEQKEYWLSQAVVGIDKAVPGNDQTVVMETCPEGHGPLLKHGDMLFCPTCKFTTTE